jgi:hypothetical protein
MKGLLIFFFFIYYPQQALEVLRSTPKVTSLTVHRPRSSNSRVTDVPSHKTSASSQPAGSQKMRSMENLLIPMNAVYGVRDRVKKCISCDFNKFLDEISVIQDHCLQSEFSFPSSIFFSVEFFISFFFHAKAEVRCKKRQFSIKLEPGLSWALVLVRGCFV